MGLSLALVMIIRYTSVIAGNVWDPRVILAVSQPMHSSTGSKPLLPWSLSLSVVFYHDAILAVKRL
jgi:hypothetical protein